MMVEFCPAPMMFTESVMFKVPVSALYCGEAALGCVSVKVPTGMEIVSVPGLEGSFAFLIASRKLHEVDVSALLTLLHVVAIAPGTGSSLRLTKKVGSGSGINIEGADSPW